MSDSAAKISVPVAIIEILNDLLSAELNSIFRFMDESSPYLSRATAEVRRPLAEMVRASHRRAGELYQMIESLGGTPIDRGLRAEEQYLAFLSLKFLLPKLVDAKKVAIQRYESALAAIQQSADHTPEMIALLNAHLDEKHAELASLELAAEHVAHDQSH